MRKTLATALSLAAVLAVAPAFAASSTAAQQCTSLQKQFDAAITSHATAPKAKEANTLRADAGKLCTGSNASAGVQKLQQALNDIGVKPMK